MLELKILGIERNGESDYNDQLIVSQVISGQKELFRLLVRRHERTIYGMGLSFLRNSEDASDFVQEVFFKSVPEPFTF